MHIVDFVDICLMNFYVYLNGIYILPKEAIIHDNVPKTYILKMLVVYLGIHDQDKLICDDPVQLNPWITELSTYLLIPSWGK